jgi:hypothetical protein
MNLEHKEDILRRLSEAHQALKEIVEGLDLELIIHDDTQWRIRDIIGHIATWDRVLIHAIQTFLEGSNYLIPGMVGDETDYNAEKVEEQRKVSTAEILQEWEQAREDFIAAVRQIPAEKLFDELTFPWGDETGSVTRMIEYMIEHDGEHLEEILEVLKKSRE